KSHSETRVRPARWRVVQRVSRRMVADRLQPPPPPPSFTFGNVEPPMAVTLVFPHRSIWPPDRNIRSTPPRAARSKKSSNRMTQVAPRIRDQSLEAAGMKTGSGSTAYVEPS